MDNNIRKIRNTLLMGFLFFISAAIIMIVLHETDMVLSGTLADNKNSEFTALVIMELLTIAFIPLALKLLKLRYVRKSIASGKYVSQLRWSILRLCLIGLPMAVNVGLYYSYMNAAFGYMAIIGLICMFFIYPSMEKCTNESVEER